MTDYFIHRVIFWLSCQQNTIVLSSTKAKYIALSNCSFKVSYDVLTSYLYSNNLGLIF